MPDLIELAISGLECLIVIEVLFLHREVLLIDDEVLDGRHLHLHVVLMGHKELRQLHFHEDVIVLKLVNAEFLA